MPHSVEAAANEIQTWAFQALVSLRIAEQFMIGQAWLDMAAIIAVRLEGINHTWEGRVGFHRQYHLAILFGRV